MNELKTIHLISGLPRSGSTLLCNILNQNPRFNATSTSGILDIIVSIRNGWEDNVAFRASPNKNGKKAVMKGILYNYYDIVDRPIIFDKSRGWCGNLELAKDIIGGDIKVLVPVRSILDILASFEKLWRTQAHEWQFPQEKSNYYEWQTLEGRADVWMMNNQPVGIAYNKIRDALSRGFAKNMFFIEFEHLTNDPENTLKEIYEFIDEPYYEHDFNNVEQSTSENDDIHGIPGLHKIRNKVLPVAPYMNDILNETIINKYNNAEFWRVK